MTRSWSERGGDRNRHADHAGPVAAPAALGLEESPQRQNEADARDQIGEEHPGGL